MVAALGWLFMIAGAVGVIAGIVFWFAGDQLNGRITTLSGTVTVLGSLHILDSASELRHAAASREGER